MATLKDIALSLNLSTMAVSKAMRNAPDISKATKDRVMSEAQRLGYIPNQMARSLRGGTSRLLGVVVPSITDPYVANIVQGLEEEASGHGYQLLIASSKENVTLELEAAATMLGSKVEALFVFPIERLQQSRALLDAAAGHQVPIIFLHRYPAVASLYKNTGWVAADAQVGAEKITSYLIEKGHRQIVYLSGQPASSFAAEHLSGFKRALSRADIPFDDQNVFLAGRRVEDGRQIIMRVLEEKVAFTAVVCVSDAVATGACQVLVKQGYKVPEEISIVGFGDGILAKNGPVPLTTIHQPQTDMGKAAFNLWQRSVKSKEALSGRYLPVEIIERGSVGAIKVAVK